MRNNELTKKNYSQYLRGIYNRTGNGGTISRRDILNDIGAPDSFFWIGKKMDYIKKIKTKSYAINLEKMRQDNINNFDDLGSVLADGLRDFNTKNSIKKKNTFTPPELNEVVDYFVGNRFPKELGKQFFEHYAGTGWTQKKGTKNIKSWKGVAQSFWFKKNEYLKTKEEPRQLEISEVFPVHKTSTLVPTQVVPAAVEKTPSQKRIKLLWGMIDITI